MKASVIPILAAVLLAAVGAPPGSPSIAGTHLLAAMAAQDSTTLSSPMFQTLIEPGLGVGPLKLGDTRARVLELFPKKFEDQEWGDNCGATLNWVDVDNKIRGGSLFIRMKEEKVFQIDSATTRFQTAEGIAPLDPPEKVAHAYKDLHAYTLLTPPAAALGDRPLVFWVDKKKGIAFAFAYYPAKQKRYLYKIIVFVPNKTFCPEGEKTNSTKWQQIDSYSLEPPSELAPHRD